jgi:hypothetical protein
MVAVHDGCVKKGLSCNSAFTLAPTSALFSRGQQFCGVLIYDLLLLLQFRDVRPRGALGGVELG